MNKRKTYIAYVPHGINPKYFYPMEPESLNYKEYVEFRDSFYKEYNCDFVVFWNNRNIWRKQPGTVVLAFNEFCKKLTKKEASKVVLLMHTHTKDPNGTDIIAVKEALCPDYKIVFSEEQVSPVQMNFYYNIADVTLNVASNEGFGLSGAESIMTGTPIISNVTGGLQDQCRFEDEKGEWIKFDGEFTSNHRGTYKKCGVWAKPVFPTNISLQGSVPTPYIFDDRCDYLEVAEALLYWYKMPKEDRELCGLKGREWAMGDESGMSERVMSNRFRKHISFVLDNWKPVERFSLEKIGPKPRNPKYTGITK